MKQQHVRGSHSQQTCRTFTLLYPNEIKFRTFTNDPQAHAEAIPLKWQFVDTEATRRKEVEVAERDVEQTKENARNAEPEETTAKKATATETRHAKASREAVSEEDQAHLRRCLR